MKCGINTLQVKIQLSTLELYINYQIDRRLIELVVQCYPPSLLLVVSLIYCPCDNINCLFNHTYSATKEYMIVNNVDNLHCKI